VQNLKNYDVLLHLVYFYFENGRTAKIYFVGFKILIYFPPHVCFDSDKHPAP
jgi:hypothetical protein